MTVAAAPSPATIIHPVHVQSSNNLIQVSNTTSITAGALTHRQIALNIEYVGNKIPENEVRDTLQLAEAAIASSAHAIPDERIPTDEFHYSREASDMLIMIIADPEEGLTWIELARVLQTLYQFMTGAMGHSEAHYNALNFQMEDGLRNIIGNGVVWYLPPLHSVQ